MPVPNATGTQGNSRPAPASARTHWRKVSMSGGQKAGRDGAKPPAGAAARGGQVPAYPRFRPDVSPCSATLVTPYDLVESARLPDAVFPPLVERMQKLEGDFDARVHVFGETG